MDRLLVTLDPTHPPGAALRALLDQLPGDWQVEAALNAWRAQRAMDGLVTEIGWAAVDEGWVLSWRLNADIPDKLGLGVVVGSVAAGTAVLAAGTALGGGLWAVGGSMLAVFATLQAGKIWVLRRMPDTQVHAAALAEAIRGAVAAVPGVSLP